MNIIGAKFHKIHTLHIKKQFVNQWQKNKKESLNKKEQRKQKKQKIPCLPVYSEPTDTKTQIQMTISMSYDETHKILFNGNISANTPWENIFTLEDNIDPDNQPIKLIMATQDPDDYNNQSFKTSARLKIITDVDTSKDIK